MKVGTDGVLLGAWTKVNHAKNILDIGTGTGLIALMLAQKSNAQVDAIEIDRNACMQAKENFENSKWSSRLKAHHISLQEFMQSAQTRYDIIVSNPPFFSDAFKAPDQARNLARHAEQALSFEDLLAGVTTLLNPGGKFFIILPSKEGMQFVKLASSTGLYVHEMLHVKTRPGKQEKRLLICFGFDRKSIMESELQIHEDGLGFTQDYMRLTEEFYPWIKSPVEGNV